MQKKYGPYIKKARESRRMTQQELADRLHVSKQTVSNWETSVSNPELSNFEQIAKILDVSADYLLGLKQNPNNKIDTTGLSIEIISDFQILIDHLKKEKK